MKLCRECKKNVSTEAKACPYCGASKPTQTNTFIKLGVGGIFAFIVGSCVIRSGESDVRRENQAAENVRVEQARIAALTPQQRQAEIDANAKKAADAQVYEATAYFAAAATLRLRAAMKNPKSFELDNVHITTNKYICLNYHSANSFNALMPGEAIITPANEIFNSDQQLEKFRRAWNKECTKPGRDATQHILYYIKNNS